MTCAHCGCQTINGPEISRPTRWRQLTYHTRQGLHSTTQAALTGQSTNETRQPWGGNSLSLELDLPVHPDTHTHTERESILSRRRPRRRMCLLHLHSTRVKPSRGDLHLSATSLSYTHTNAHTRTPHTYACSKHTTHVQQHTISIRTRRAS